MSCPIPTQSKVSVKQTWTKRKAHHLTTLHNQDDCITFDYKREIVVEPTNQSNFLDVWGKNGVMDNNDNYLYLRCFMKKINHQIYILRIPENTCNERLDPELVQLPENWSWNQKHILPEHYPCWFHYECGDEDECVFRSLYNGKYFLKQTDDFKSVEFKYFKNYDFRRLPTNCFFKMYEFKPPRQQSTHVILQTLRFHHLLRILPCTLK